MRADLRSLGPLALSVVVGGLACGPAAEAPAPVAPPVREPVAPAPVVPPSARALPPSGGDVDPGTPMVSAQMLAPKTRRTNRLGPCVPPSALPADTLTTVQEEVLVSAVHFPVHMLDIAPDPESDIVYLVGMAGLYVMTPSSGGYTTASNLLDLWIGEGETEVRTAQFSELEPLSAGLLAVTNRDFGLSIIDASEPTAPVVLSSTVLPNAAGMSSKNGVLAVVTHSGELLTFDITDPSQPTELGRLAGLGNPWDVDLLNGYAYVADNLLGLAVVDVRDPGQPRLLGAVETAGGAQDIDHDDRMLYLAVGSAGVEVFDPVNPASPKQVARVDYGTAVVSISAAAGRVWGATHEDVFALDTSNPTRPRYIGRERTDEHAMAVYAEGDEAFVADWSRLVRVHLDPAAAAPVADPERPELVLLERPDPNGEPRVVELPITNRGGGALIISGAELEDRRFDFEIDNLYVASGGRTTVRLSFYNDGGEVDDELCLATNDPDQPLVRIKLRSTPSAPTSAGEIAPDFILPTIESDNDTYRLSDHLGRPVVLVYFALW